MDDLLSEFLTETHESLDVVDVQLVQFEQDPNDAGILDNVFRLVHTIKGTCGFLGLPRLEALAHSAETLMGKYRDGAPVTKDGVSLILNSIDRIKDILNDLAQNGTEPEGTDGDLIEALDAMSAEADAAPSDDTPAGDAPADDIALPAQTLERELKPGEVSLDELERAFRDADGPSEYETPNASAWLDEIGDEAATDGQDVAATDMPAAQAEPMAEAETKPAGDKPAGAKPADAKPAARKAEPGDAARADQPVATPQSIRVNVDTLEHLITMVSELVLTRNQLLEIVRRHEESEFKVPLQRLSNVTAELQEGVMKTRMQPIGNAWQKLPRIVRDLGNELSKDIELEMIGAETELDRQVLELIKDPLTHMVRNSADHGLEDPAGREAAGKSKKGIIRLSAYHEGGHINIEIADDGRGIDAEKLKSKIVEKGLASEADLDKMTEAQIQRFIFHPGFSMAAKVTNVSGRGVGMDVVKTNIDLIGGSIDLKSVLGEGTTFIIKIPLTLAIVSALIVECAGQRFAIPQLAVVELVRAQANSEHRIERIKDTPVLRLRNKLLPLVSMRAILGLGGEPEPGEDDAETGFIVVTRVGGQTFGIVVDGVFHTEEIVVKPMSSLLRDITLFSGNTILGDGSVIMIIDPNGVTKAISADIASEAEESDTKADTVDDDRADKTALLVFRAGSEDPKAVPLSLVTRLEEIGVDKIESADGRDLVQYRGALMPLVFLNEAVKRQDTGAQPMLVFSDMGRSMGLAIDEIVDIVEENLNIEVSSGEPGIVGTAVVRGRATEIVDVAHFLPMAFPDWFKRKTAGTRSGKRLLLVDDSPFFRNMLAPVLRSAGYDLVVCENGREALSRLDDDHDFDAIISDIEMPEIDGFRLAELVTSHDRHRSVPVIALSSHTERDVIERGRQAGFHDFVAKFDRQGLLATLDELAEDGIQEQAA